MYTFSTWLWMSSTENLFDKDNISSWVSLLPSSVSAAEFIDWSFEDLLEHPFTACAKFILKVGLHNKYLGNEEMK